MTNIGVCHLHILPCASILCVCLGDCGLPLTLFQVDFRVLDKISKLTVLLKKKRHDGGGDPSVV